MESFVFVQRIVLTSSHQILTTLAKASLILLPGMNNLTLKSRETKNIKTRHKAIEINTENLSDRNRRHTSHFRTQDANWDEWCTFLDNNLSQLVSSFPNEVSKSIIITTSASSFFSITEKSKYKVKGGRVILKNARNNLKNAKNSSQKRQSHANLNAVLEFMKTLLNLIKESKFKAY